MAIAIFPKRWSPNVLPPTGVRVQQGHPLAQELVGCWLFNEGSKAVHDLSKSKFSSNFSSSNWGYDAQGFAVTTGGIVIDDLLDLPATYNFTIWCRCARRNSYAVRASIAWGGTDDLIMVPFDSSGGDGMRVFWRDVGGSLIDQNGVTLAETGLHDFAFLSRASNDHRGYVDGVEVDTSTNTGTAGPFNSLWLGAWKDGGQDFSNGTIQAVYIWARALLPTELQTLHVDPWAFLVPQAPTLRRSWIEAAVPVGGVGQVIDVHPQTVIAGVARPRIIPSGFIPPSSRVA